MKDQASIQARIAERIHHEIAGLITEGQRHLVEVKKQIIACDPSDQGRLDMLLNHSSCIGSELVGLTRAQTAVYRALVSGGIID